MRLPFDSYKCWDIEESGYPDSGTIEEKIKFMLGYAILAPSAFNCQPWKCRINNNIVNIYLDTTRITKKSDKTGRFAYISLGCFIENLLATARFFGYITNVEFSNEKTVESPYLLAATVHLIENNKDSSQHDSQVQNLFSSVKIRATNRSPYLPKEISLKNLKKVTDFVNEGQKIINLGEKYKDRLIDISLQGDRETWGDYEFRKEHVMWVRNNLTRAYDGMPGFGVGIGLIPSFFAYPVILSPLFPKLQAKKNALLLKNTLYFLALCSKDTPNEWLKIGMLYEQISLYLSSLGIVIAPLGHFIESDTAREELNKLTENSENLKPQLFCRVGYPSKCVDHSPRLPVEKIII